MPCCLIAQMMERPSTGFLARRSSFQHMMRAASPRYSRCIMSLKTGRPGSLADFDSVKTSTMGKFSFAASSCNSRVCDSMERTCRSSASDDLRQYMKCPGMKMFINEGRQMTFWRVHHANVPNIYVNGSLGQRHFDLRSRQEGAGPESQRNEEGEGRSRGLHRLKESARI